MTRLEDVQADRPATRPLRETYARVSVQANGWTLEPALEWRSGRDSYQRIVDDLTLIARRAAERDVRLAPPELAEAVGQEIASAFPDRAFFVETWDDVLPGFGQCYQPYGVPRDR